MIETIKTLAVGFMIIGVILLICYGFIALIGFLDQNRKLWYVLKYLILVGCFVVLAWIIGALTLDHFEVTRGISF